MLPIRLCLALVASTHAFAPPLRPAVGCKLHRCEEPPKSVICRASGGGGGASELTREGKLIVSILIDLIGMSTYLLPVAGEGADRHFDEGPLVVSANGDVDGAAAGALQVEAQAPQGRVSSPIAM